MVLAMADVQFPPSGACDCHVHVIGPKRVFPLAAGHAYMPMDAPVGALVDMLRRLALPRVVLVQPSFYRTDNACMLDAMAQIEGARGVAVLSDASNAELDDLHARGIRGLRINIATLGVGPHEAMKRDIEAAAALCARNGWHVQVFVPAEAIEALSPTLLALPADTVIDHFGLIAPGVTNGALTALLKLLQSGKVWVKISGAYRIADDPNDAAIGPLARKLCAANPQRIVWGSDWPHTPKHGLRVPGGDAELPFQDIDTRGLLELVPRWLGNDARVHQVLVSNPARLYGFE
jgi:predicted TIM-barrel fold metal-dependent hydrolase